MYHGRAQGPLLRCDGYNKINLAVKLAPRSSNALYMYMGDPM